MLVTDLKPGEPWTFCSVSLADISRARGARPMADGFARLSKWYATNEPGRVFRIERIHENAMECVYLGMEVEPGTCRVEGDA